MPPYRERGMSGEFGRPYDRDRPGGFMGRGGEREIDEKQQQRAIIEAARYEAELLKSKANESKAAEQAHDRDDDGADRGHPDDHFDDRHVSDRHAPPQMNAPWDRRGPHEFQQRESWGGRGGRDRDNYGPRTNPPMDNRGPTGNSWDRGAPIIHPDPKIRLVR